MAESREGAGLPEAASDFRMLDKKRVRNVFGEQNIITLKIKLDLLCSYPTQGEVGHIYLCCFAEWPPD